MKHVKQLSWGIFLFISTLSSQAASFPRGCESQNFKFESSDLIMNETGEQRLFLLFNHTNQPVELQRHETSDTFMSPSLSVKLAPGSWAAFASDIPYLVFECHVTQNDNAKKAICADALDVCEYPRAKFALSNMGNYWLSANKSQHEIVQDAAAKGIYLHW